MAGAVIRVVLADDQVLVRSGFRALLSAEDDIEVVGDVGDGDAAVAACRDLRPDIVLMDIRMPGLDGIEATRAIAADPACAGVRVLILTTFELDEYVCDGLEAGASGFLVKHTEPAELVRAVRVVAAGEALLSPGVTRRLIAAYVAARAGRTGGGGPPRVTAGTTPEPGGVGPPGPSRLDISSLTVREREVVGLVASGLSNDEIAGRWVVSNATVRTHVSRAMTKLHARDRAQLVVFAHRCGLVGDDLDI